MEYVSRRRFPRKPSTLKGIHLPPSDISRRLYCTSRPSWWNHRCPRRTNGRPLKRDEERKKKTQLTSATEFLGRCPKGRFIRGGKTPHFIFLYFSLSRACEFSPRGISFAIAITLAKLYISLFTSVQIAIAHRYAILLERTVERASSFIVSHIAVIVFHSSSRILRVILFTVSRMSFLRET